MKTIVYHGSEDVRTDTVPDPTIEHPADAIIKVTLAAICGSDSHLFGGYAGGQAEMVRVPFADVNHFKVPEGFSDEQVLFMGDIFPTGYMAAENCSIEPTDTIAVWGCGPVGQFAIRCAKALGAKRIIAVDSYPERLAMAEAGGAETINDEEYKGTDVFKRLKEMTRGEGPHKVIDAVGLEAHGTGALPGTMEVMDKIKQLIPGQDRGNALRETIYAVRKGGTVSIAGAYAGMVDNFPMGIAFNKGLQFRMGQTHVHRYYQKMLELIQNGTIDPSFVITHRMSLDEGPQGYKTFRDKEDNCIKVVLKP